MSKGSREKKDEYIFMYKHVDILENTSFSYLS